MTDRGDEPRGSGAEGWDRESLDEVQDFARVHHTTGLVIVQAGATVVEEYWPPPPNSATAGGLETTLLADGRTLEDVASAQKSITSVLIGIALGHGLVDLDQAVTTYLGPGWTNADAVPERRVTVRHLMCMTSGLDDAMRVVAPPGQQWDYNLGAGYHTLKRVLAAVGGANLADLTGDWLLSPLGMTESAWTPRKLPDAIPDQLRPFLCYPDGEPLEGFTTSARDLGTFGSAVLAGGRFGDTDLGLAPGFLEEAMRPSTPLNPAYGMLWWVNGQDWQLRPKQPDVVEGWLLPDAPSDTVSALGAQGRAVHISPSRQLVVVRIGANPDDDALAASAFGRDLWTRLARALPPT